MTNQNTRTPSPATGSAVPASTASPSPVGEGQPVAWMYEQRTENDKLTTFVSTIRQSGLAARMIENPLYLAAQAPKPASGGGELTQAIEVGAQLRNALYAVIPRSYPGSANHSEEARQRWEREYEYVLDKDHYRIPADAVYRADELLHSLRGLCAAIDKRGVELARGIAAEADTAKEPTAAESLVATLAHKNWDDPPAADRLAQTVTDADLSRIAQHLELWRSRAATSRTWDRGEEVDLLGALLDRLEDAIRARESAPAQEPVAWRFRDNVEGNGWQFMIDKPDFRHSTADWYEIEPLYAAAPRAVE